MNIKTDILDRGFVITEEKINGNYNVRVLKRDTDKLELFAHANLTAEVYEQSGYFNEVLKKLVTSIEVSMTSRHSMNVSDCQHNYVMIFGVKGCSECMGKFGSKIELDLNWN